MRPSTFVSKSGTVGAGEGLRPDHAIGDDLGGRTERVSAGIVPAGLILKHSHRGELDRLGHEVRVEIDRAQRRVELAKRGRAAEPPKKSDREPRSHGSSAVSRNTAPSSSSVSA